MTANYVGIDQSYTGLAIVAIGPDSDVTFESLNNFESAKFGTGIDRLLAIYQCCFEVLTDISQLGPIAHIAMEGYSSGSKFGREIAGELGAIIKIALYDFFDRAKGDEALRYPTIVQPSAVKKFVTNNGAAKKNVMIMSVFKKWGFETNNDNVADAYALAKLARAVETSDTEFEYEKAVLTKVKPHTEMPPATIPTP